MSCQHNDHSHILIWLYMFLIPIFVHNCSDQGPRVKTLEDEIAVLRTKISRLEGMDRR